MTEQQLSETESQMLENIPEWKNVERSESLLAYFRYYLVTSFRPRPVVENDVLVQTITDIVKEKYDVPTSVGVQRQLQDCPLLETGNAPRSTDLSQGSLIVAALMKRSGCKYHVGLYEPDSKGCVSSDLLNACLGNVHSYVGIKHVAIDKQQVTARFLAACLRRQDTVWHQIFTDEKLRADCAKMISPEGKLLHVKKSVGELKTVAQIADALDAGAIVLNPALQQALLHSASMITHGSVEQSRNSVALKKNLNALLRRVKSKAPAVSPVPDMSFAGFSALEAVTPYQETRPMSLKEVAALSLEHKMRFLHHAPFIIGSAAVKRALKSLQPNKVATHSGGRLRNPREVLYVHMD